MNLMPILFWDISQVVGQWKFDIFPSKMQRKKQQGSALRHQNIFNIKTICTCTFLYSKLM